MTKPPSLYDLKPIARPNVGAGNTVTATVKVKQLRAMISALEGVGLVVVRDENNHLVCRVNGQTLLHAAKGRAGTYLTRYAEGVKRLMEKK